MPSLCTTIDSTPCVLERIGASAPREPSASGFPMELSITSTAGFQGPDTHVKVELTPLTQVIGTMVLCLPLTFAQHLEAGTID